MVFAGVQSSDQSFASTGIATAAFLGWPHAAVVSSLSYRPERSAPCFAASSRADLLHEVEIQCPAVLTIQLGINTPRYASLAQHQAGGGETHRGQVARPTSALSRRRRRRGRLSLARAAHVYSGQGPSAAHRGGRGAAGGAARGDHPRIQGRCRHERHAGDCGTTARRTAPRIPGADRRRRRACAAPARASRWPSSAPRRSAFVEPLKPRRRRRDRNHQGRRRRSSTRHLRVRGRRIDRASASRTSYWSRTASTPSVTPLRSRPGSGLGFATDVFKRAAHRRRAGRDPRRLRPEGQRRGGLPRPQHGAAWRSAATYSSRPSRPARRESPSFRSRRRCRAAPTGARFIEIARRRRCRHDGRGVHPDHRPRHRRGSQGGANSSELADAVGATLGCSRPIADAGWLPKSRQIGQSGKTASACKLYIAMGVSGAIQHLAGHEARGDHRRREQRCRGIDIRRRQIWNRGRHL